MATPISQSELERQFGLEQSAATVRADWTDRLHSGAAVQNGRFELDVKALLRGSTDVVREHPVQEAALQEELNTLLSATDLAGWDARINTLTAEVRHRAKDRLRDIAALGGDGWMLLPRFLGDALRFVVALWRLRVARRSRKVGSAFQALTSLRGIFQSSLAS